MARIRIIKAFTATRVDPTQPSNVISEEVEFKSLGTYIPNILNVLAYKSGVDILQSTGISIIGVPSDAIEIHTDKPVNTPSQTCCNGEKV